MAGFLCTAAQDLCCWPIRVARAAEGIPVGKHRWLGRDVPWSGTVTLLSISLVVAQRLRKLDFPVKDSEEPSIPGVDKNLFLRPRGPGEDTGKVSALGTWGQSPVLCGAEGSQQSLLLL